MKILIVSEFFPRSDKGEARGGVEIRSWEISKRLAEKNDVTILTSKEYGLPTEDRFFNIKIIRCGISRKYSQDSDLFKRFIFMVSVFIKVIKIKPDIVDAQSIITYLPVYFSSKLIKFKKFITVHDVWLGRWIKFFGRLGYIGELYEKIYLSLNWDNFITISEYTKKNLIVSGVNENKIKIIHNGIDWKLLNEIKFNKFEKPTICSISRLVKYKKIDDLIKSLVIVKEKFLDIQCKIIGSGPEKNNLEQLVIKLGLEKNVIFEGFVKEHKDVLKILKNSHIFCLPSSVEGFGIVNLEAMACGIPVVASDIEPIKEITENGQGALLFPLGNVAKISENILILLTNETLYNKMVNNGKIISQKYDWNSIADLTYANYSKIK